MSRYLIEPDYSNVADPMTKKDRDEVIKNLLSGEYLQGTGVLCSFEDENADKPRYCCLGVVNKVLFNGHNNTCDSIITFEAQCRFLPDDVQCFLATLNDKGTPFYAIAAVFRKIKASDE